jgi:hypothetical protein
MTARDLADEQAGAAIECRVATDEEQVMASKQRCTFDHDGNGPQCSVETDDGKHDGPHLFKCAGTNCPGYMWPASVMPHPNSCNRAVPREPQTKKGGCLP